MQGANVTRNGGKNDPAQAIGSPGPDRVGWLPRRGIGRRTVSHPRPAGIELVSLWGCAPTY